MTTISESLPYEVPLETSAIVPPTIPKSYKTNTIWQSEVMSGIENGLHSPRSIQTDSHVLSEKPQPIEEINSPNSVISITLDDSEDPLKMSEWRKWTITMVGSMTALAVTFGSSVFTAALDVMSRQFHVSELVMLLGLTLYVAGFAAGPLLWAPLSERYGRKMPLLGAYSLFVVFQVPLALAENLQTVFISRFLAGAFGSAPIVINSASFADYWEPTDRGKASAIYSLTLFGGPTLGPIIGNFLVESHLGWRWTAWITLIFSAVFGLLSILVIPETYRPVLIQRKAKRLGQEIKAPGTPNDFVKNYLTKPVFMIVSEPMLIVMTIYISIDYGILYLTFFAYPWSFTRERGWAPQIGSLPFLSILVGCLITAPSLFFYSQWYYQPRLIARGKVLPEDRLPPMIIGGVLLPVGLFWFGWTSSPDTSWVPQVLAGVPLGAGIMLIFSCGVAYIIDVYLSSAASAMAANTVVRSLMGAGFPLFAPAMYKGLGTAWATSLLGFICVAMIPAPILFYFYGNKIRAMSEFSTRT